MSSAVSDLQIERPKRAGELTVTWSIQNYSHCTLNEGQELVSPDFEVEFLGDNYKWFLSLFPLGRNSPCFLSCYLFNRRGRPTCNSTLSIRNSDGKFKEGCEKFYDGNEYCGHDKFVSHEELKGPDNFYLANDMLTVRCRIWKTAGTDIPPSVKCDIHSKINGSSKNELKTLLCRTTKVLDQQSVVVDHDVENQKIWVKNMQQRYEDGKFSDFIIRTPSRQFPVHKMILSAHSEVFEAMFERDMKESKTGMVDIEDVDDDTVSKMLMYIYTNTFYGTDCSSALKLYVAADKYRITDLQKKCSNYLKSNLDDSNICEILLLADALQDQDLKSSVIDYIYSHAQKVLFSESWKKLTGTNPLLTSEVMQWIICFKYLV